jgi:predicted O-linked N-acetylglucosamine transferase (SPINDLY family)
MAADSADSLIAEGNRAEDAGDLARACELYRRAVSLAPRLAKAHLNLGVGLEASGDAAGALAAYEKALAIDPASPAANYNLGKLLYTRGAYGEAERRLKQALESRPQFPEGHIVRGYALHALGELEPAASELETGLAQRPEDDAARAALSRVRGAIAVRSAIEHHRAGRWSEAQARYQAVLEQDPENVDAHYNLGRVLHAQGKFAQAIASFRQALELAPEQFETLKPDYAAAHCSRGTELLALGRFEEAANSYKEALKLDPASIEARYNLGIACRDLGDRDNAIQCFREVIGLQPGLAAAHYCLGHLLREEDRLQEALECFRQALVLDPQHVEARWSAAMAQIPNVYGVGEEPSRFRSRFYSELEQLERWFEGAHAAAGFQAVGSGQPFGLAYQEEDNREVLQRYGALCARLMGEWFTRQSFRPPSTAARGAIVRVGVVSAHLRSHSVWHAMVKGWFRHLDRERFELHAYYLGAGRDEETAFARSRAARFEQGGKDLRQWVEAILAQRPDVLIYPEIGMDTMTVKLASLRLAPVQVASWGHPETSGLPTIDYYLSAEGLEPVGARACYSEELVRLPNLGCCFEPRRAEPEFPDLAKWGIEPADPVLLCPGVPFKYAPQHDAVLVEIARRLDRGRLVFFAHWQRGLTERLRIRLEAAFARAGVDFERHVSFVPWQSNAAFYGWLKRADLFLDTIGFSGFNTALQAVECDLPIVTREGRYMRGRLASGILKRIDLHELVAPSEVEYVDLAIRLVQDPDYSELVAERMAARRPVLFEDMAPIRALEEFLGGLKRARQGL